MTLTKLSALTRLSLLLVPLIFVAGCAPDIAETDFYSMHPDPDAGSAAEVVLLDHVESGTQLTLVAREALGWGFNAFRVEAAEGWQSISPALVYEVGASRWTSPLSSEISDGAGVMYAVPPPVEGGEWFLEVSGSTSAGSLSLRVPVTVEEDIWVRPANASDLIVAWVAPTAPKTGNDDFEVALYRYVNGQFEAVTNASLDLYPYMDMGGGEGHSTPYSAPTHVGGGRYKGDVNFIMSGGWDMTVIVTLNGQTEEIVFAGFTVQ